MGPSFVLLPWIHGAFLLALVVVGVLVAIADALEAYQAHQARNERDQAHRLARIHADAQAVRSRIEA